MLIMPKKYIGQFYNGSNVACDMIIGPCACGATHDIEEWLDKIKNLGEKNKVLSEALKDMYFAYINKDTEFPHDFEVAALKQFHVLFPKEMKEEPGEILEVNLPVCYSDLVEFLHLCNIYPTYITNEHGTICFQKNNIIGHILDYYKLKTEQNTAMDEHGLNRLWSVAFKKQYTVKQMVELYIHMGYSLSMFLEIFGDAIDTILRIRHDSTNGDFLDKSGPTEETIKLIHGPIGDVK